MIDSFTFVLAVGLFIGLVVGGVGSITGALFGGLFVLFVPNFADQISRGLAGAVYGAILLLLIYAMPSGAARLIRLIAHKLQPDAVETAPSTGGTRCNHTGHEPCSLPPSDWA